MRSHLLCDLELPTVSQVLGDPSGPERVVSDPGVDACRSGSAPYHPVGIGLGHRIVGELPGAPFRRPEQMLLRLGDRDLQVRIEILVE